MRMPGNRHFKRVRPRTQNTSGTTSLVMTQVYFLGLLVFPGALAMEYDDFGLYPTYTFYIEEGILHNPRMIGNITLEKFNTSNYFRVDETEFNGPNNRKSKAKPQYFDVKFLQDSPDSTTATFRKFRRSLIGTSLNNSTVQTHAPTAAIQTGSSGGYEPSTMSPRSGKTTNTQNFENTTSWKVGRNGNTTTTNEITASSFNHSSSTVSYRDNKTTTHSNPSEVTSQQKTSSPLMTTAMPISTSAYANASGSEVETTAVAFTSPKTLHSDTTTTNAFTTWWPLLPVDDHFTGELWQIYDLDREESDIHYLTINTYSQDEMTDIPVLVVIKVSDINDNSPVFVQESLKSEITKEAKMGEIVAKVQATDADIGQNAAIQYSILDFTERKNNENASPDFSTFSIHGKYGVVFLMKPLDELETPSKITFGVVARDNGGKVPCNRATATVTVSIVDTTTDTDTQTTTSPSSGSDHRTSADITVPSVESKSSRVPLGVVIPVSVVGVLVVIAIIAFVIIRRHRKRQASGDGTLAFMLDDGNPQYHFL